MADQIDLKFHPDSERAVKGKCPCRQSAEKCKEARMQSNASHPAPAEKLLRVICCLIALTVTVFVPGCSVVDNRYAALEPHIESDPAPNAIVGMWHRRRAEFKDRASILFTSDGTVHMKFKSNFSDATRKMPYNYTGNGVWLVQTEAYGVNWSYQLANGSLIETVKSPGSVIKNVYDRVSPGNSGVPVAAGFHAEYSASRSSYR